MYFIYNIISTSNFQSFFFYKELYGATSVSHVIFCQHNDTYFTGFSYVIPKYSYVKMFIDALIGG